MHPYCASWIPLMQKETKIRIEGAAMLVGTEMIVMVAVLEEVVDQGTVTMMRMATTSGVT